MKSFREQLLPYCGGEGVLPVTWEECIALTSLFGGITLDIEKERS